MRYACLVYDNPKQLFGGSPEAQAALDECAGFDEKLQESGHFMSGDALELPTRRWPYRFGRKDVGGGCPFIETKEVLGGVVVIEACCA